MKQIFTALFLLLSLGKLAAQEDRSSALFRTLKTCDSQLFNIGFNTCDISQFERLVSDSSFEFYHDKGGITGSKAAFIRSIREGICKLDYKPRRALDESSLEVYRLEKNGVLYGALQMGRHRFYALEGNQPERLTSVAKFIHVWLMENGQWKFCRGISFDHQSQDELKDTSAIDTALLFTDKATTERWLANNHIPALGISYSKDGKILSQHVWGVLEKGRPAPLNTIWNVASLTKPITALVALKLIDAGSWSLDEPIYKYWTDPDVAADPRAKQLSTRHILSHQTGFPNWRYQHADGKLSFEFDPGTKFQYSGEGFEYLRKALEHKFHKSLNSLADSLIFRPLHMTDTRYYWDASVDETRFAKWYSRSGEVYDTYKNTSENGADDLLTTIGDYSKLEQYVLNGAGLSKDLYKQMVGKQVQVKKNKYWGLGWWIDENIDQKGTLALVHGGDDKGVHTMAFILPATQETLLIFTNCDNGTDSYIPVILHYLGDRGQAIIDIETK